jgi:hypothetical protein
MVASFGWSWFAFSSGLEPDGAEYSPRITRLRKLLLEDKPLPAVPEEQGAPGMAAMRPQLAPKVQPIQRVQRVYRFPMHELSRASLTPAID